MDIGALLGAAGRGDQMAWKTIVDRYQGLVWSVARGFRLSDSDAQDAVQTTWLRLVERLETVRDADAIASWLATTVRRECLQLLRRSGRERPVDVEDLDHVLDPAPALDHGILLDERDTALWRAFDALQERCKGLLRVLMADPPMNYAEVSAALNMPVGSIGPTRQRCLDRLRSLASDGDLFGRRRTETTS